ncbi:iron-containing redox enzyme family protein [Phytohabitans rumicis]|uniref:Biliverdin-producing heme oxygenase n=1 Tax=Phytohabitans rumicis TaxID=1076125 RepID=A0A6V8KPQ3_9ACTN|nr:iron-containing redox enzyme family protein [Phytohabitans rumicis]GFJ87163.1 biliverdin-producing heme oxygenase [Phytohabitans rumicis]
MTLTTNTPAPATAGARLTAKLRLTVPAMLAEMTRMWDGPAPAETYLAWLRVMHGTIRATVPLMLAAAEACLARTGDPVADEFAAYLARHIREEYGHDRWVEEDYAAAGGDPVDLAGLLVGGSVAALVGAQYYWIRHVHPIALLGHIAVLEGYPPQPATAGHLAGLTGLPPAAFRSLERHAVLDQKHRADVYRLLDALPLTARHEALIGVSALHTAGTVREIAAGVRERHASSTGRERR